MKFEIVARQLIVNDMGILFPIGLGWDLMGFTFLADLELGEFS